MERVFLLFFFLLFSLIIGVKGQEQQPRRPKVGVVLSGGGAKGLAHIGVLKVLEEAGIPVDYIGGTSMGSIIGGLYALGYSAHQLDSIVRRVDWDALLSDRIPRSDLSMVEKDEDVKYLISFPIRGTKIALPTGIVTGQNINGLLSRLCAPAYQITDFSKLPVPFLCVATDIEKGQAVVFRNGDLVRSMRASMAIPTVFTPEEVDGKLFLDGGLVNNFPVKEVKDMGADIIIGVDVGFRYYKKDQLNSLVRIIEQSIFMHTRALNNQSRKMCNIYIRPELTDYNASSFNRTDSLIAIGERAARNQLPEIDSLARLFQKYRLEEHPKPLLVTPEKLDVREVEIQGLGKIPRDFLLRKLTFSVPSEVSFKEIDAFISQMYGTWFFDRITYQIVPLPQGVKLVFHVIEKNTNYFRVGLHYDSDFKTTLMLNTTFRNLIAKGSKISLDLALGENPSFTGLFYKNTGWRPSGSHFSRSKLIPDYGFRIQTRRLEVYGYEGDKRIASYNFSDFVSDFFIQANPSNKSSVGAGIEGDYTAIHDKINYGVPVDDENFYADVYVFSKRDTYDETFYPHQGARVVAEFKYYKGVSPSVRSQPGFFTGLIRADYYIPLTRKISFSPGFSGGTIFGNGVPYQYRFYLGGLGGNYLRGLIPFVGLDLMQRSNLNTLVAKMDFQWEIFKDNYLMIKSNIGKTAADRKNLFQWEGILAGAGISYGYKSPIGPMEFTLMTSNHAPVSTFINIGYWF